MRNPSVLKMFNVTVEVVARVGGYSVPYVIHNLTCTATPQVTVMNFSNEHLSWRLGKPCLD